MPRKLHPQYEDLIDTYTPVIQEYIEKGEAYLGRHERREVPGFRTKLTYFKSHVYTRMGDGDTTAGRVYVIIRRIELVWYPIPGETILPMVHVYWKPDRIMAARAAAGLPVTRVSEIEQATIAEAREWLLSNL